MGWHRETGILEDLYFLNFNMKKHPEGRLWVFDFIESITELNSIYNALFSLKLY